MKLEKNICCTKGSNNFDWELQLKGHVTFLYINIWVRKYAFNLACERKIRKKIVLVRIYEE